MTDQPAPTPSRAEQTQQILDFIASDAPKEYLKKGHDDYARKRYLKGLDYFVERLERIGCPTDAQVIDIGCGAGNWAIAHAVRGGRVYAFDREEGFARLGRDIAALLGLEGAEFGVGTAEDPAAYRPADFALVNNSMMWIEVDRFIQVLSSFLPAGGRMYGNYSSVAARVNTSLIGLTKGNPAGVRRGLRPIYGTSIVRVGLPSPFPSFSLTAAELLALFEVYGYRRIAAPQAHDWKSATEDAIVDFVLELDPASRTSTADATPDAVRRLFELEADTAVLEATRDLDAAEAAGVLGYRVRSLLRSRSMDEAAALLDRLDPDSLAPVLFDVQRSLDGQAPVEAALDRLAGAHLADDEAYVRDFCSGVVLLHAERPEDATEHFRSAVDLNPGWRGGWVGLLLAMADDGGTSGKAFSDTFRDMVETAELGIPAGAVVVPEPV